MEVELAAGALAVEDPEDPPELSLEEEVLAAGLDPFEDEADGLAEEYRSLYQPPPENCTAGAWSRRSSFPLQSGQVVSSGSENFWIFSRRRRQAWHSYS